MRCLRLSLLNHPNSRVASTLAKLDLSNVVIWALYEIKGLVELPDLSLEFCLVLNDRLHLGRELLREFVELG